MSSMFHCQDSLPNNYVKGNKRISPIAQVLHGATSLCAHVPDHGHAGEIESCEVGGQ